MRAPLCRWIPIVILLILVIFGYTEGTKQPSQMQTTQPFPVSQPQHSGVELPPSLMPKPTIPPS